MKRFLICLVIIALSISIIGCNSANEVSTANIKYLVKNTTDIATASNEYRIVYENDNLIFKFKDATTDVCVVDKSNNFEWSTAAKSANDESLYNILYLSYHTDAGNVGVLSTSNHCLSNGQYKVEEIDNGLKVKYTLGEVLTEYIYPESLIPERYDYFYNKCDDDGKALLEICYTKIDISFYDEVSQKEMREKYPFAVDDKIYIPRSNFSDALKSELSQMFSEIGYTKKDLETDHTVLKKDGRENIAVNVSVYYIIENDTFSVRIPEEEIEYPSFVHIDSMNVLECFAGATSNNGYFVLPDGSGSIMEFRNSNVAKNYRTGIYGEEKTIYAENSLMNLQNAIFPVYGCVSDKNAYFAVIEDGESHGYINATSGSDNITPRAWVDFTVEPVDYMIATSNSMVEENQKNAVYQTDRYDGDLLIKYKFFSGEKANYSEMASYYREYLFCDDKTENISNQYPLSVQTVGAVSQNKTIFGFNYSELYTLTTLEQSEEIVKDLLGNGIKDINLILKGFSGSGYEYGYSKNTEIIESLGKNDELKSMIDSLGKKDISVYFDFDVQYASEDIKQNEIAELLDESKAVLNIYDKAVFEKIKSSRYILTPKTICDAISNAYNFAKDINSGISISSLGRNLNSDYNTENTVDRQDSKKMMVKSLSEISEKQSISSEVGNAYILPFVNHLNNVSVKSNGHDMCDYSIPFVGMVLSGYVDYSAPILNDSNMEIADLLRVIESNASLGIILTQQDTISIDISDYDLPTSTKYDDLKKDLISSYEFCLEALDGLYGQRIIKHNVLSDLVRELEFENGCKLYINYSNQSVEYNGKVIEPLSYVKEVA